MDWLLLAVVTFYFLKGCWRGFAEILFSILSTVFIFVLSYKLCQPFGEFFEGLQIFDFQNFITNVLNGFFDQNFSSAEQLATAINSSSFFFKLFLSTIVKNISFDGQLSAGEVLSPIINSLFFKVVAFLMIYVGAKTILVFIKTIALKAMKKTKLVVGNRILGGAFGVIQGLAVFIVFYVIMLACANAFLNEKLLQFCQSGAVSNFIYNNFTEKIINLFY